MEGFVLEFTELGSNVSGWEVAGVVAQFSVAVIALFVPFLVDRLARKARAQEAQEKRSSFENILKAELLLLWSGAIRARNSLNLLKAAFLNKAILYNDRDLQTREHANLLITLPPLISRSDIWAQFLEPDLVSDLAELSALIVVFQQVSDLSLLNPKLPAAGVDSFDRSERTLGSIEELIRGCAERVKQKLVPDPATEESSPLIDSAEP